MAVVHDYNSYAPMYVRSSFVSIITDQRGQEKLMGLNTKLGPLPISLNFWIKLVLHCLEPIIIYP